MPPATSEMVPGKVLLLQPQAALLVMVALELPQAALLVLPVALELLLLPATYKIMKLTQTSQSIDEWT